MNSWLWVNEASSLMDLMDRHMSLNPITAGVSLGSTNKQHPKMKLTKNYLLWSHTNCRQLAFPRFACQFILPDDFFQLRLPSLLLSKLVNHWYSRTRHAAQIGIKSSAKKWNCVVALKINVSSSSSIESTLLAGLSISGVYEIFLKLNQWGSGNNKNTVSMQIITSTTCLGYDMRCT